MCATSADAGRASAAATMSKGASATKLREELMDLGLQFLGAQLSCVAPQDLQRPRWDRGCPAAGRAVRTRGVVNRKPVWRTLLANGVGVAVALGVARYVVLSWRRARLVQWREPTGRRRMAPLSVRLVGDTGPPMLLLHGLAASSRYWDVAPRGRGRRRRPGSAPRPHTVR